MSRRLLGDAEPLHQRARAEFLGGLAGSGRPHARLRRAKIGDAIIAEGDWLSIDGDTGEVFLGQREIVADRPEAALATIETWRAAASQKDATALALAE